MILELSMWASKRQEKDMETVSSSILREVAMKEDGKIIK